MNSIERCPAKVNTTGGRNQEGNKELITTFDCNRCNQHRRWVNDETNLRSAVGVVQDILVIRRTRCDFPDSEVPIDEVNLHRFTAEIERINK